MQTVLEAIVVIGVRMVGAGFVLVWAGILVLYFPRVVRFKLYLRKHDPVAHDLSGGLYPWSADSSQAFKQYFALEHYKLLRDPAARALVDKIMAAEKTLTRMAWLVLWIFLITIACLFARMSME